MYLDINSIGFDNLFQTGNNEREQQLSGFTDTFIKKGNIRESTVFFWAGSV